MIASRSSKRHTSPPKLRRAAATVAEHDRRVAGEAGPTGALERRAPEAFAELGVGHRYQRLGGRRRGRRRRLPRRGRVTVPRTDLLADVAAEEPVADRRVELVPDTPAVLDRQVGDAAAGGVARNGR